MKLVIKETDAKFCKSCIPKTSKAIEKTSMICGLVSSLCVMLWKKMRGRRPQDKI